jgi:hypothetical protein
MPHAVHISIDARMSWLAVAGMTGVHGIAGVGIAPTAAAASFRVS